MAGTNFIYLNGRMVPKKEAVISVLDHSFLYGIGVFETLKSYSGHILYAERHVDRLFRSAEVLFITIPVEKNKIISALYRVLEKNKLSDAYIRITVSLGEGEPGLDPSLCAEPNIVIYAKQSKQYPDEWYSCGVKAALVSIVKSSSGAVKVPLKSCCYLYNYLAKQEAAIKGAVEGIMLSAAGSITEGTVSNVFIVKKGVVLTPPADECVLDGITRGRIIKLALENSIEISECHFTENDLLQSEECFLTNTSFEVLPVTKIDNSPIGSGKPGEITGILAGLYKDAIQSIKDSGERGKG